MNGSMLTGKERISVPSSIQHNVFRARRILRLQRNDVEGIVSDVIKVFLSIRLASIMFTEEDITKRIELKIMLDHGPITMPTKSGYKLMLDNITGSIER